jgi:hypothetical protein
VGLLLAAMGWEVIVDVLIVLFIMILLVKLFVSVTSRIIHIT